MKPTLLFLHFFGGSGDTWREVVALLTWEGYTCLAPDLRGFGDSRTVGDFSFAANVRDVRAICDSLMDGPVVLVGHAMGGKIALAVASGNPPNLAGLVLIAPSPPTPEPMEEVERMRLLVGIGDRHVAEVTLGNMTASLLPDPLRERFLRDSVRVKPAAWRDWLEDGTRLDLSSCLPAVCVPSLLILGAEDEVIAGKLIKQDVMPHLTNPTIMVFPNAAHLVPLEQPEMIAEEIDAWWASHAGGNVLLSDLDKIEVRRLH